MNHHHKSDDHKAESGIASRISQAIAKHAHTTKPESHEELNKRDRKHLTVQWAGVLLAALYAAVTLLLWINALGQARTLQGQLDTARKQLDISNQQMEVSSRAFVVPLEPKIMEGGVVARKTPAIGLAPFVVMGGKEQTTPLRVGETPFLQMIMVNSGATPAKHVVPQFAVEILPALPNDDYQLRGQTLEGFNSSRTMPKDGQMPLRAALRRSITADDLRGMTKGPTIMSASAFLVIFGTVVYEDVFNKPHWTHFCSFFNNIDDDMSTCPHYNDWN